MIRNLSFFILLCIGVSFAGFPPGYLKNLPSIYINIWGDGKPVQGAVVFCRFYTDNDCGNGFVNIGTTNSTGRIELISTSDEKGAGTIRSLSRDAGCNANNYMGAFPGVTSYKVNFTIKISAPGYKPYSATSSYQNVEYDHYFFWKDISIDALLEQSK
jgi:hypothetical protein